MLTLESKFSEFILLVEKSGGCPDAIQWMNRQLDTNKEQTLGDAFKAYVADTTILEGWSAWNLEKIGKELDDKCRQFFIDKIKNEMTAFQLRISCDCLTTAEHGTLLSKYEGKLPTAEKEVNDGIITLCTAAVKP